MKKSLLALFAIASGFAVGNLYFIQPLLGAISNDLHTSIHNNGFLVTAVQLGYIAGILFLLPLGDVLSRKRFVPIMMTIAGLGQIAISQSTNFTMVAIAFIFVGFTTISGQILVPLTSELSDSTNRGKNSSFVVAGMMIGILAARTISGTLSDLVGWHITFALIGVANILLAWTLHLKIPMTPIGKKVSYPKLVSGIFSLWVKNPWVLRTMLNNAMTMMVFSATWTSITFLLASAPFNYNTSQIGIWGLVGVVGASAASFTGRSIDSGKGDRNAQWAFGISAVAMAVGSMAQWSLVFLLVSLILREFSGQAIAINNQTKLLALFPEARSRVNTGYVSINFVGQAVGSVFAVIMWPLVGWVGIQLLCCGISLLALALWFYNKRTMPNQMVY